MACGACGSAFACGACAPARSRRYSSDDDRQRDDKPGQPWDHHNLLANLNLSGVQRRGMSPGHSNLASRRITIVSMAQMLDFA